MLQYKKLQIITFHKNVKIIPSAERSTDVRFIEIALRHGCSPVNLLHIFRTTFLKNTSGGLFLLCGCPTANFGSLSKGQSLSPDVNQCFLTYFDPKVIRSLVKKLDPYQGHLYPYVV